MSKKKSSAQGSLLAPVKAPEPLAYRLRPESFNEVVGQAVLSDPNGPLARIVASAHVPSLILWGPPGCGKTTLARLLAEHGGGHLEILSAVQSGVADLKAVFAKAEARRQDGVQTILFVDEIHRFNRAQQDAFLPVIESGIITLIGATTENPSFELNSALLSRCRVIVLTRLGHEALAQLLKRAESIEGKPLPVDDEARSTLVALADGDGRYLLNLAEALWDAGLEKPVGSDELLQITQARRPVYDKAQESHYNLISALHKSLRGSDCDAALYWFARMLEGGEDPRYIARRLIRFASEDVGMADPQALPFLLAATESYERLGSPEGELALAQAVIYLGTAPKSNAVYKAYGAVKRSAKSNGSLMPPKHILNAPTKLMKQEGYGAGYAYDHNAPDAFSGQNYFPDEMERERYYHPVERGFEREITKRLDYWDKLRRERAAGEDA